MAAPWPWSVSVPHLSRRWRTYPSPASTCTADGHKWQLLALMCLCAPDGLSVVQLSCSY